VSGGAAADHDNAELLARITQLETRTAEVERERDQYRKLYELAREQIERLKRGLIGHKATRPTLEDGQLTLSLLEMLLGEKAEQVEAATQVIPEHVRRKAVRKPFPEHLPRVTIELVPPEVEREGLEAFEMIGVDRREVLERRPASVVVVEVVRKKFVRKEERGQLRTDVLVAETPELPIPRSTAGPGLLADTIVKRWQDHLPLARQESIYQREGIELARSTLCGWHIELADLAAPLLEAMHTDALGAPYVCADATGVLVQYPGRCKYGHFWVLVAPGRHALFKFSLKHDGVAVDALLRDYKGYVVVDAHKVYDHIFGEDKATEVGCWSHMRQYVLDALVVDVEPVREAMACIQALFLIERSIDRAPPAERASVRKKKSKPIVERFFAWCDEHRDGALDGSPLADAIRYATNQQEALERFLEDGRLPMHNNVSERNLRRQAIGRKNWLFVGSEDGAKANTTFVSLLASCAMHRIEPWSYLRDLLCLLPSWPVARVLELAPVNWQATLGRDDVQAKLAANIFRRVTLPGAERALAEQSVA